jgi:electron transfer flavoprotein beta subunit
MTVAACLKWVDHRAEVDPLTGAVSTDARTSGPSDADLAALAWALRTGAAWDDDVLVVTAGGTVAESALRDALAAGATRAVRVDVDPEAPSEVVAAGLAPVVAGCRLVVCGAWSEDRGSGSVPAYLAAHAGAAQALGLIDLAVPPTPGPLRAGRRLDGGRRERLEVPLPAVVSVEAGTARPPRAALGAMLAARHTVIEVRPGPDWTASSPVKVAAYRPRARRLDPPTGDDPRTRVLALTGTATARSTRRVLTLEPGDAAEAVLEQLRDWGYL